MDLGLRRVDSALRVLGLTRPPCVVAHVVGTNGKGSVSLMLSEIMRAHGLRVGLSTSPHFVSVRERVLVDGRMLSEATWTSLGNEVLAASSEAGLTYFEFITVLAVAGFARAGCDVVVMEAGLGGRYDAASALATDLTVFTSIGLDHTNVLGKTLAAIAGDKAGAMRKNVPAVSAPQLAEVREVLRVEATAVGAPFRDAPEVVDGVAAAACPAMAGPHQRENAQLALAAWIMLARRQGWAVDPAACDRAVGAARLPGRFQRVSGGPGEPELILDGAHNPPAMARLAETLADQGLRPGAVIFACMADKDLATMASLVTGLSDGPLFLPVLPGNSRALSPEAAAAVLGPRAVPLPDLAAALERARAVTGGPVLLCGSLYMLGEFFTLRPDCLVRQVPDIELPDGPDTGPAV